MQIVELKDSEWARGASYGWADDYGEEVLLDNYLYSPDTDTYCCLGVLSRECGVSKKDMEYIDTPYGLAYSGVYLKKVKNPEVKKLLPEWLVEDNLMNDNGTVSLLVEINDSHEPLTDEQRVMSLNRVLEIKGIPVRFKFVADA